MGLNLSDEVEFLARELAAVTHEDIESVVATALRERMARLRERTNESPAERTLRLQAWLKGVDARPRSEDSRSWRQIEDEDLYDEAGRPIG